jgi:hypothetical protein
LKSRASHVFPKTVKRVVMPRIMKTVLYAVGIAIAVAAVVGVCLFRVWRERVRGEYYTASVIRAVTEHVESHDGMWPKNWAAIGETEAAERFVAMRFDLTSEQILSDTNLIFTSIVPKQGPYIMYPHGNRNLLQLLEIMRVHSPEREGITKP